MSICLVIKEKKNFSSNKHLFQVDEFVALTDDRLSLHGPTSVSEVDNLPQYRLTDFCVYDKHRHLTRFDTGIIDNGKDVFFSGVVKSYHDKTEGVDGGVRARGLGPTHEWWIGGFESKVSVSGSY